MKKARKMQGITLIALIVTIILLLILAGISIGVIGGSNGILNRASQALDANDKATATEKMELKITYLNMVSFGENTRKATLQELADGLCADEEMQYVLLESQQTASLAPIEVGEAKSIFTKLKKYPYEFEINSDLQLASVDGVKVATTNPVDAELKKTVEDLKTTVENLETSNEQLKSEIEVLKSSKLSNEKTSLLKNTPITIQTPINWNNCSIDIELLDSFKNYKYLEIQCDAIGDFGSGLQSANYYPVEQLAIYNVNDYSVQRDNTFSIALNVSVPYRTWAVICIV